MTLKIHQAININTDDNFTYYVTNLFAFDGMIKIPNDKVENFETALKGDKITVDVWNKRLV